MENENHRASIMNDLILTRNYFNELANEWDDIQTLEQLHIEKLLRRLRLQQFNSILDLGCGTGVLFPYLNSMTNPDTSIYAIDFADCMTQIAKNNDKNGIQVVCGDVHKLPFNNGMFEMIIAFHVFPHIHRKLLALAECRRVLKHKGKLAILHVHSSEEINSIHAEIGGAVKNHTLPSTGEMSELLEQTGFSILDATDRSGEYIMFAEKNGVFY